MFKKTLIFSLLIVCLVLFSGCATARKQRDLETQGLRNQVLALETQLRFKDAEIESLRETLAKAAGGKEASEKQTGKKRVIGEVKSRPSIKNIQVALKNAGYNPGAIDGRMGKGTREAIKAFQRDNNLAVDGKAGRQTWGLLREYLYRKVK